MSRATPQIRDIAARLIAFETEAIKSSTPNRGSAFHACERLRPHLATLMGQGGFRAVLARALSLAKVEMPWVAALQVDPQGALEGWDKPEAHVTPEALTEGGVIIMANLLGLLVAFIGINLALRLLREVWPEVPLADSQFTQGDHS